VIYIGVNTGTSADAVDCAAFEINAHQHEFLHAVSIPMPVALRKKIIDLVEAPVLTIDEVEHLKYALTGVYVQAIQSLLKEMQCEPSQVRAIGLHGQTLHHRPDLAYPYTVQLGSACAVANCVGIAVADRFREIDIALGGQGAPLIPAYHRYLLNRHGVQEGVFLNLGGIANATVIEQTGVYGWDIGPANALMDLWAQDQYQIPYDKDGKIAQSGQVIQFLLKKWMSDPYFAMSRPKSTGRDYFSRRILSDAALAACAAEDVMATLCELTAQTVQADLSRYADAQAKKALFLFGKGINNQFVLQRFKALMPGYILGDCRSVGVEPEWLESGLFAWLAYCYTEKIAIDLTSVTGAKKPAILGSLVRV
jgi:anhydro-N-acetylmuramic acid kinase